MRTKIFIILFLNALVVSSSFGQVEKFKALFMYKFIQGMEWPSGKVTNAYTIAVLGEDKVFEELKTMTNGRLVNNKKVEVIQYTPGSSMSGICMLFIGHSKRDLFESVQKEAIARSAVVITETPGLAKQGAFMNFITVQGKLKYEMNKASFESTNVKVNGSLEALAILVD